MANLIEIGTNDFIATRNDLHKKENISAIASLSTNKTTKISSAK